MRGKWLKLFNESRAEMIIGAQIQPETIKVFTLNIKYVIWNNVIEQNSTEFHNGLNFLDNPQDNSSFAPFVVHNLTLVVAVIFLNCFSWFLF